jgi:hypothetical protein
LLGYSSSFTHRKDGPGAARPWWVQGGALAAGGDFAGFSSEQSIGSFLQKRTACFLRQAKTLLSSEEKRSKKDFYSHAPLSAVLQAG